MQNISGIEFAGRRPEASKRWTWTVRASATGAGVAATGALGATVQISQTNNDLSMVNGVITDRLQKDVTGDGVDDFPLLTALTRNSSSPFSTTPNTVVYRGFSSQRGVRVTSSNSQVSFYNFFGSARYSLLSYTSGASGTQKEFYVRGATTPFSFKTYNSGTNTFSTTAARLSSADNPVDIQTLKPVTFTDSAVNLGAPTNGFLQIDATNTTRNSHSVVLVRLIFDDASTVAPSGLLPIDPAFPEFDRVAGQEATDQFRAQQAAAAAAQRAAQLSLISRKIKKEKGKLKKARQSGNANKVKKIKAKIKKLTRQLRAL